jgi:outer membrane protein TolC
MTGFPRAQVDVLAIALLLPACAMTGFEDRYRIPDERVDALLSDAPWADRTARRERPAPATEAAPAGVLRLDVVESVNLALKNNRDLLRTLEGRFQAEIDAELALHSYWPLLQPLTVSSAYGGTSGGPPARADAASVGIAQRLPYGGSATLAGAASGIAGAGSDTYALTPTLSVSLPLWRNAGAIVANNAEIGALRSAVYAGREMEQVRQVLAIDIARRHYSLIQARMAIRNLEINLENARKLRNQSEAMFRFGRVTKTDLFRAEFQVSQAENDLLNAVENRKLLEDVFKIQLAIPPETPVELTAADVAPPPETVDDAGYVDIVRAHNILWKNTQDRYEDEKRSLHVAADALNPRLDLTGGASAPAASDEALRGYRATPATWSAGLALEIPLDRLPLARDYQAAVLRFLQAERGFVQSRDELARQARERVISVKQGIFNVRLQQRSVDEAEKAMKVLTYEYRQGKVANRDVIEAQNKLIAAQNQLLQSLVGALVARLEMRQFAGQLQIDPEGQWLRP